MQHIEFIHTAHFQHRYHRQKAGGVLRHFIDFFWETSFDDMWADHPEGFSDALFANIGYTYLINLGTPFVMQLGSKSYPVKGDGFLPRNEPLICHHSSGNKIFGIKFNVSPVLLQKTVNFREYREYIFPLTYLIDRKIVDGIKSAPDFVQRVTLVEDYYKKIITQHQGSLQAVSTVTSILMQAIKTTNFSPSLEAVAQKHGITSRTLQRYFEKTTGSSSKQALQLLRIRKAVEEMIAKPDSFHYSRFGYYDYSHFHKQLTAFLNHPGTSKTEIHLLLMKQRGTDVPNGAL